MSKDQVAFEAAMQEMEWLQAQYRFVGNLWVHTESSNEYIVVLIGLRESDLAVIVSYQKIVELKAFPEKPIPNPVWHRPVAEFLEKFTLRPEPEKSHVVGHYLDGSTS